MCASRTAQDDIHAIRVTAGAADLVLGCDLVVSGTKKVLASVRPGKTTLVVNTAEVMPGDFTRNADFSLPAERIKRAITAAAGADQVDFTNATAIATALLGNAIAANMFMLGFAYQRGRVPLSAPPRSRRRSTLNGEAVKMNLSAFTWGRRAAAEPGLIASLMGKLTEPTPSRHLSESLDEVIARRVAFLGEYQSKSYARALSAPRRPRPRNRGARRARSHRAHGRRGPLACSGLWPTRTSTRSRASTPTAISRSRSRPRSRARTCATNSISRRRFSLARTP